MQFISMDGHGIAQTIDIEKLAESFKLLIEQFDAEPQTEIGLIDACPNDLLARIIGAGFGPRLTAALAEATANVLTRYPPLPPDALAQLDEWSTQLAAERSPEPVEAQAKTILAAAITGDDEKLETVRGDIFGDDPITAAAVMRSVFMMGLTLIAVAKGSLGTGATLN